MKTWTPKGSDLLQQKKWYVIDATGVPLGRLCTRVANVLTGKNKPTYTPHADMGDHVVVINAASIKLTGRKLENKIYYRHSHYPGGLKEITAGKKLAKHPDRLIKDAVCGMLPKTKLGKKMSRKLKVYADNNHPHQAQNPVTVKLQDLR